MVLALCVGSLCVLGAVPALAAISRTPPTGAVAHAAAGGSALHMTYIKGTGSTDPKLVLANGSGADPRTLGAASTAIISPNGKLVAAVMLNGTTDSAGSSLILYHATGAPNPRTVRQSAGELTLLAWSPDSRLIAVVDGSSLVIINAANGDARTVATGTIDGASFKPIGPRQSERVVYALAQTLLATAPVNLYTAAASGAGTATQLTTDGHSEDPLWGAQGIFFARADVVSGQTTPAEIWLVRPGSAARQLTHIAIASPLAGLTPVACSNDGKHLLANLVGTDSAEVWTIDLTARGVSAAELGDNGTPTLGTAVSKNGTMILVTSGYGDPAQLSVEAVPWRGGAAHVLAPHGAYASWNR
jgi:Tol biopolymer transport system component